MKYKQYLYDSLYGHKIYALKDGEQTLNVDASDDLDDVTADELRWANVSLDVIDGETVEEEDLPTFSIFSAENGFVDDEVSYAYTRNYVAALNGLCPERRLAKITIDEKRFYFCVLVFSKAGKQQGFTPIFLHNLPKWAKLVVTMEPLEGGDHDRFGTPDTYEIRNLAERGEPMRIVIDEYRSGELRRTRELGEDEKGKFEIITEP